MLAKIIVGVDARHGADAVALARGLAAPDAAIVLVHAYPYESVEDHEVLHRYDDRLRSDAYRLLREMGDDPRFERLAVPDLSPARALHAVAIDERAELIVVGTCRRSILARLTAGDTARGVMVGAPCPVAVAPHGYAAAGRIGVIGVGVDPHAERQPAVRYAERLALMHGASLRLVAVEDIALAYPAGEAYAFDWSALAEAERERCRTALEEIAGGLAVPVTTAVLEGSAAYELEQLSGEVDLLVLGSRGWGTFKRVVLGSTSDHVVHHAACPVVVVRGGLERAQVSSADTARAISRSSRDSTTITSGAGAT